MREHQSGVQVGEERVSSIPGRRTDQRERRPDLLHGVARRRVVDEAGREIEQLEHRSAVALLEVTGSDQQTQREDAQKPAVEALATVIGLDQLGELEELEVLLGSHETT